MKENGQKLASFKDAGVNLSDFALFLSVMKYPEAHESVLSIIMDEPDLKLARVHVEEVVLNAIGKRAIRLDAWAESEDERQFVTEMQNDTQNDDVRRRSRFYQGLLDTPILKAGKKTKYRELPSTIVTFITQEDIFGLDRAMYTFTEQCEEIQGLHLGDGTKKIFLNMSSKNGRAELVSLLQYMKKSELDNPEILVRDERIMNLNRIVEEVKKSEEWEDVRMSIYSVGVEDGIERGEHQATLEMILRLLKEKGRVSATLEKKIRDEADKEHLYCLVKLAAKAGSVKEFEKLMNE
ncbi:MULTISPECIES: hypothetical protein [unclassified Clostridium]|uniref:hypothetical protein n=1 Tax=unclassified Clostridium TaxID=2614128 RepID=UPI001FA9244C|nr:MULTISPECIES: hypothetical protein [unclassified Clostridium]